MIIGIIPARGGSKGVPKKNIKELAGFPLIAYSIAASLLSKRIDRTIVSTDSPEIAELAKRFGAEVPFLRPAEISQDKSTDLEFMLHAITWFEKNEHITPEYMIHLRPTTPVRDPRLIDEAIELMQHHPEATALRSVFELPESPYKMFHVRNGYLEGLLPNDPRPEYYNLPRQNFEPVYNPNGYVDIVKSSTMTTDHSMHGNKMLAFLVPNVGEIDTPEDFTFTEYALRKENNPILAYLQKMK